MQDPYSEIEGYCAVGAAYTRKGDFGQAIPMLEAALALCRSADVPQWFPATALWLGFAYAQFGRVVEGIKLIGFAVEQGTSMKILVGQPLMLTCLGEACLLAGRLNEAAEAAARALSLSQQQQERGHEAWALRLLGELCSRQEPPDSVVADTRYRQALTLSQALEMRPLVGRCHFGLGAIYGQTRRQEEAKEHLTAAVTIFRALDTTFWLAQAEAEIRALEE
jgi:tetratricopeptide (TPR) repeat protein